MAEGMSFYNGFANAPGRRQRAYRVKKQQPAFFGYCGPEAREILKDLLEKYATDGELQFTLPEVLKVPPISQHGNVEEIFGGIRRCKPTPQRCEPTAIATVCGMTIS